MQSPAIPQSYLSSVFLRTFRNPSLDHKLNTYRSAHRYCNMAYIADQLFPPIATIEESAEFSNFNFWREPVFELDDLISSADVLAATAALSSAQSEAKVSSTTPNGDVPDSAAGKSTEEASSATSSLSLSSSSPQTVDGPQQQKQLGSPKSLATIPENHKV